MNEHEKRPVFLMAAADDVQNRLPFFLFDNLERALERRQNLLWIVNHLAISAMGLDDFFIARRRREIA